MTLEQRDRFRLLAAAALVALVGFVMLLRVRFRPLADGLMQTQLDNQASSAINEAIQEQISDGEIDYDKMVTIEKDAAGNVTAMRANIGEINFLRTRILTRIDEKLMDLSVEELGVPVGSVVLPELFSGRGPNLPVRVIAVRTSDAAFRNEFQEAGINQTLHRIFFDIHVVVTILSLEGRQEIPVDSSVLVAETVIVGQVPTTYIDMEELP